MEGDAMSCTEADLLYSLSYKAYQGESMLKELAVDYEGVINYCALRAAHGHDGAIIKDEIPLEVIQKLRSEGGFHVDEWCEGFFHVCWGLNQNGELRNAKK